MTKIMKTNDLEVSHPHNCSSSTRPFLINCKFEAIPARTNNKLNPHVAVPDPDLEIRKGEGGGGGSLPEKFFRPFGPQVWSKNKGGASPGSATVWYSVWDTEQALLPAYYLVGV